MAELLPTWRTENFVELRNFSRIKLIVVDLDETLLEMGESKFWEKILELSRSLRSHVYQVDLTIATGRTLAGVEPLLKELPFPRKAPLILYNGSLVVGNDTYDVKYKKTISSKSLRKVLDSISDYQVCVFAYFYNDPACLWFQFRENVLGWSNHNFPEREFNSMLIQWQNMGSINGDLRPSAILIDTSGEPDCIHIIETELANIDDISFSRSGSCYIGIRPKGSSKGAALEYVADQILELPKEEILALGDNDNDLEMLSWAGIGVAVANASPAVKEKSDYICQHDVTRGALEVLRLVRHAKQFSQYGQNQDIL